jgi:ankyrin repeat protein
MPFWNRKALTEEDYFNATENGNLDKLKECIRKGVDKEAKDKYGWTALHHASFDGHLEIVKYLIEKCHVDKKVKGNNGWTALHYASEQGHLEIVKYLVEVCHVDTQVDGNNGESARDIAIANNKIEVALYLLNFKGWFDSIIWPTVPHKKVAIDLVRYVMLFVDCPIHESSYV